MFWASHIWIFGQIAVISYFNFFALSHFLATKEWGYINKFGTENIKFESGFIEFLEYVYFY